MQALLIELDVQLNLALVVRARYIDIILKQRIQEQVHVIFIVVEFLFSLLTISLA